LAAVGQAMAARSARHLQGEVRTVTGAELASEGGPRPAAVLCLLSERHGEAHVLLTRRSRHLRDHAGEVSFPGGRLGPGEAPLQAALRETEEEVGLPPASVVILGELTPLTTRLSPALVHCFVGHVPRWAGTGEDGLAGGLVANAAEVEKLFWVPLAQLASPGVYHEEFWPAPVVAGPGPGAGPGAGGGGAGGGGAGGGGAGGGRGGLSSGAAALSTVGDPGVVHRGVAFFDLEEDLVWGATARLLTELLTTVLVPDQPSGG
jgi:8-oxo-dGTP pyrophosphatase MutT (NUDIX family)